MYWYVVKMIDDVEGMAKPHILAGPFVEEEDATRLVREYEDSDLNNTFLKLQALPVVTMR